MCIIKSLSVSESNKNSNSFTFYLFLKFTYVTLSSNIAFTSYILDDSVVSFQIILSYKHKLSHMIIFALDCIYFQIFVKETHCSKLHLNNGNPYYNTLGVSSKSTEVYIMEQISIVYIQSSYSSKKYFPYLCKIDQQSPHHRK